MWCDHYIVIYRSQHWYWDIINYNNYALPHLYSLQSWAGQEGELLEEIIWVRELSPSQPALNTSFPSAGQLSTTDPTHSQFSGDHNESTDCSLWWSIVFLLFSSEFSSAGWLWLATTNVTVVCSAVLTLSCTDPTSCRNAFLLLKIASSQDVVRN